MTFAEALRDELYSNGYSYQELANCIDVDYSTVSNWCNENEIYPNHEHCRDLDEFFDRPCGYFNHLKKVLT